MSDFEVNSADYWESRFEGDWAQTQGCEQTRFFARILLQYLPAWLENEIRSNHLSVLDWGCAEGEAVDAFHTHFPDSSITGIDRSSNAIRNARRKFGLQSFNHLDALTTPLPVTFDILVASNVLQYFDSPWQVLAKLGTHVSRHILVLAPFREPNGTPRHLYTFDDATIGTRIDPDFVLSSSRLIDTAPASAHNPVTDNSVSDNDPVSEPRPQGSGAFILLVYTRTAFLPQSGAIFDEIAATTPHPIPAPPAAPSAPAAAIVETTEPPSDPIETILLPQLRKAKSIAVVTSAIPFSAALNQRPICCAKYFADRGVTVLFVEVWQCPEQAIHPTGEELYPGVWSIPFYAFQSGILHTFQDNLDRIASASEAPRSYLCTLPTHELVDTARVLRKWGYQIHYDIMDDWEAFLTGDQEMTHWFSANVELEMIAIADTVTAVSTTLVEKFRRVRSDIAVVRNGYQPAALAVEQFAAAHALLEHPKIVGYFGHFSDAWFDWETVLHAAKHRPGIQFELIGYGLSEQSLMRLNRFPNIRYVGLVPQPELHQYVTKWWAGMIPFQASVLSAAVDPLKVYEYLHFGLPTIVTGIPGIAGYPLVDLAFDSESFLAALDRIPDRPDEQSLAQVAEFLKTCVWEERLRKLSELMEQKSREDEVAARTAVLHNDLHYWQARSRDIANQAKQQEKLHQLHMSDANARQSSLNAEVWVLRAEIDGLVNQMEHHARGEAGNRTEHRERDAQFALREAEFTAREAALNEDLRHWRANAIRLEEQIEEAGRRFKASQEETYQEMQSLSDRVFASEHEAADLRRLTSDILRSRSWKLTAPLRFLSKPLLSVPEPAPVIAPKVSIRTPTDPMEPVLRELRQAQSVVVVSCAVPFGAKLNQRPISCARYLADRGVTVIYVVWQWSKAEALPSEGAQVYPRVFQLSLPMFQSNSERLAKSSPAGRSYLCNLPGKELVTIARSLRAEGYHIHYDIMDDWEEFHRVGEAPWYSAPVERELLRLADTASAVSPKLAEKFASSRNGIAVVPNGYQPSAMNCPQFVAAHAPLVRPKVIGYFGHLADGWFDWETVWEAARKNKDVEFELIGYGLSDRTRAKLGDFPNIRFLGFIAQNDLHRYARKWWAGMIPFQPSALSAAVDPLKVYEYLHLGLPTVATGLPGIAAYPLVEMAASRENFLSALERIESRPAEQRLSETAAFLKTCVWDARLEQLHSLLRHPNRPASR